MSDPKKFFSRHEQDPSGLGNHPSESRQESSMQPKNPDRQTTIHAVRDFLKQNSAQPQFQRQCGTCGKPMQYMDAYFWLDGTDVASLVPLPFCPACEHDVLTSLRRKRGIGSIGMAS